MAVELASTHLINDANLVSYWKFEGDSTDSIDSNNGSDTGITYSAGNGKFDQGAGFNGSSSVITKANAANQSVNNLTVVCWLNPISGYGGAENWILAHCASGDEENGWMTHVNSSGNWVIGVTAGTGAADHQTRVGTTNALAIGSWTHVAATYDGTNLKIYVNGQLDNTVAHAYGGNIVNAAQTLTIGKRPTWDYYYKGAIDDLAFFNRALTSDEINLLYLGYSASISPSSSASSSVSASISPSSSASSSVSASSSPSSSASSSVSASSSPSSSASQSPSASLSPSASISPSQAEYDDKYSTIGNTYTNKYSSVGSINVD